MLPHFIKASYIVSKRLGSTFFEHCYVMMQSSVQEGMQAMSRVSIDEIRKAQRTKGPATVLAIATATPQNEVIQADCPDYYFKVTNSEQMTDLKEKFKRICTRLGERPNQFFASTYLTEDVLKENPNINAYMAPSIDARQEIAIVAAPELSMEAAAKAIKEGGHSKSMITHLVFYTWSSVDMPGADYQLTKLLGLHPSIKRYMIYQQGCFAGGMALWLAKDLAKNNAGARVLIVCSETTAAGFRGPSDTDLDNHVTHALFGNGAASVIIGADPNSSEQPIFQLVSASQTILPDSEGAIRVHLCEVGSTMHLVKEVSWLISKNIEKILAEAFEPLGINDWNSIFWIVHPGGVAILDQVEEKLNLKTEKLRATRHVLSEFGNMSSTSVLFILDEMRRRSAEEGKAMIGEGLDWGVLFGFGPGLNVKTVVLHSLPITVAR